MPSHRELACVLGLIETSVEGNNQSAHSQSFRQRCLSTCLRSSQHIFSKRLYISQGDGDSGELLLSLQVLMQDPSWMAKVGRTQPYEIKEESLLGTVSILNAKRDPIKLKIVPYIRICPKD